MTTDITELAQLKPGKYAILYRDNWDGEKNEYHTLAVLTEEGGWYDDEFNAELLKYQGDKILKVWPLDDGSNVLALVEALEKAQQVDDVLCNLLPDCRYMDPPDGGSVTPLEQVSRMIVDYRQRIAELEDAEQKLCAANVTLDARAELAELQLAELESRTVTAESMQESAYRAGLTAGWNLGLSNNNDGFNKCLSAHGAGINREDE